MGRCFNLGMGMHDAAEGVCQLNLLFATLAPKYKTRVQYRCALCVGPQFESTFGDFVITPTANYIRYVHMGMQNNLQCVSMQNSGRCKIS
jgi:hypothetical protein